MSDPSPVQPPPRPAGLLGRAKFNSRRGVWLVAAIVVFCGLFYLGLRQFGARFRSVPREAICAANLRQLGQALRDYARAHDGEFPPSLHTLVEAGLSPELLRCPTADRPPEKVNYVYRPGRRLTDPPEQVLAYEPFGNHMNLGGNVLRLSGEVTFLSPTEHKRAVEP